MSRKAIILAAGKGSRLAPLTPALPKELLPLEGLPVLHHALAEAADAGVREVVIVLSEEKDAIKEYCAISSAPKGEEALKLCKLRDALFDRISVSFVYQKELKGTADAILAAGDFGKNEPILILYPDDVLGVDSVGGFRSLDRKVNSSARLFEKAEETAGSVVLVREIEKEKAGQYGVLFPRKFFSDGFTVKNIIEKPKRLSEERAFALVGRMVLSPRVRERIASLPASDAEGVIPALNEAAKESRLFALTLNGLSLDVGSHEGYLHAVASLIDHDRFTPF